MTDFEVRGISMSDIIPAKPKEGEKIALNMEMLSDDKCARLATNPEHYLMVGVSKGDGGGSMKVGASGSVRLCVVRLAKALGATATGVCGTRNLEIARSAGADIVIDYKKEDFAKKRVTYDAIIAVNGYNPIGTYKDLLNATGKYIAVGGTRQATQALILGPLLSVGSRKKFRAATCFAIKDKDLPYLKELVDSGQLKPVIDKVYPVESVTEAIRAVLEKHVQGRL